MVASKTIEGVHAFVRFGDFVYHDFPAAYGFESNPSATTVKVQFFPPSAGLFRQTGSSSSGDFFAVNVERSRRIQN